MNAPDDFDDLPVAPPKVALSYGTDRLLEALYEKYPGLRDRVEKNIASQQLRAT